MERVSFINKVSNVMKATADDESPIPGYLYPEISTLESDGSCESLLEFLVDRLDRKSSHVKVKVLKLMKYVVENGNPNFAMGLRKKSRGIKEATSYGGPPDPLHGNIPYILVRKAAKELSELLFDTETTKPHVSIYQKPVMKSKGGMGGASRSQGMEGFGNSPKQQEKTLGSTLLTGLNKLVENVTDSSSSQPGIMMSPIKTAFGDYTPVQISPATPQDRSPSSSSPVRSRPAPRKHIPGRAGGGWDDDLDSEVKLSSGSRSDGSQGQSERYESTSSTEDWSNEESLVTDITEKSDHFLLTRTEISQFLKKCPSVNCEKTVEILNRCLQGSAEHVTMKCLQLIEGLLRCDLVNLEFIAATCRTNLISVYHTETPQARAKAKKIIRILEKLTSHANILPPSGVKPTCSGSTENRVDVFSAVHSGTVLHLADGTSFSEVKGDCAVENLEATDNYFDSCPNTCAYVPAFPDSSDEHRSLDNTDGCGVTEVLSSDTDNQRGTTLEGIPVETRAILPEEERSCPS